MNYMSAALLGAGSLLALSGQALASDVVRGKDLFLTYCDECHTTNAGGSSRKGPNLWKIDGRTAGTLANYEYSYGNQTLGWVWSATTLDNYLIAPRQVVPSTTMKFKGIPDASERHDLIAYLLTLK